MVFVLGLRMQVGTRVIGSDQRWRLESKKLKLWLRPGSLTLPYHTDLEPLGTCSSESLKQSKSSRLLVFFEIGTLKHLAIFTGKHCAGVSFNKVAGLHTSNFFKKRFQHSHFLWCKIFKDSFFIENLHWLILAALTAVQ